MILTRSELAKMAELFDAQELPDTFPDDLEFSFLEVLAPRQRGIRRFRT